MVSTLDHRHYTFFVHHRHKISFESDQLHTVLDLLQALPNLRSGPLDLFTYLDRPPVFMPSCR